MRSSCAAYSFKPDRYLVDNSGKPRAVVLSLIDFRKMVRHIEDLEDSVALKRAIRSSRGTVSHHDLIARLKSRHLI